MKKLIWIFFAFCALSYGQNQDYEFNFEPDGQDGDKCNWLTFENIASPQIIDNPDPDGVNNTISKVLKVIAPANGGQCYSGVNNSRELAVFGEWDITQSNDNIISFDINKNYIGTVGVQMIGRDGSSPVNITNQNVNNTIVNEWITLTYTIPAVPPGLGANVTAFVIFIDWTCGGPDRTQDAILHVDNIKFNANKVLDPPTLNQNLISSLTEDFESTTSFLADEASDFGIVTNPDNTGINTSNNCFEIAGVNDALYTNAQLSLTPPETLDFCSEKGFSVMVRGPRASVVSLKVEENQVGALLNQTYTDVGNWQELNYDFSAFQNRNWNRIVLFFDIEANPSANANDDIFLFDNLNFNTLDALSISEYNLQLVRVNPNPTKNYWHVEALNSEILTSIIIYDLLGKEVLNYKPMGSSFSINASNFKNGIYLAKLNSLKGSQTFKLVKN